MAASADAGLRPTADRARESLFSVLDHRLGGWQGRRVADLCAGTGTLGFEALSRGASAVTFVEQDAAALAALRASLALFTPVLPEGRSVSILSGDIRRLAPADRPFDLLLLDPPYHQGLIPVALVQLAATGWVDGDSLLVCEHDRDEQLTLPDGWHFQDQRRWGRNSFSFLRWSPVTGA